MNTSYTELKFVACLIKIILMSTAFSVLAGTNAISKGEVVGTWKIDSSSYTVRSLATPNSFPRPELPTNHTAFSLTLKKDGSFVVTNFPSDLFFGTPSRAQGSGRWYVRTQWVMTVKVNGIKLNPPDENEPTLQISFRDALGWDFFEMPLFRAKPTASSSSKLSAAVGGVGDQTGSYEWSFAIRKQD